MEILNSKKQLLSSTRKIETKYDVVIVTHFIY